VDLTALAEDGACAKEPNAGHDLGCDPGRVGGAAKGLEPQRSKQAGANSDQAQGLDPCRVAVELPLKTDGDREDRGKEETKGEVEVAVKWQFPQPLP
jgi:hypothetical protein